MRSEFNVVVHERMFISKLKQQVIFACNHAPYEDQPHQVHRINIEPSNNVSHFKKNIEKDRILTLRFSDAENKVYVYNPHEYLILITLALRQLLITNDGFSERELNSIDNSQYYKEYFQINKINHIGHELQHYLAAMEQTDLTCRFGVYFYEDSMGANFKPVIGFNGIVSQNIYRDIIHAPSVLSKDDLMYK
jgi:hypothetical protein